LGSLRFTKLSAPTAIGGSVASNWKSIRSGSHLVGQFILGPALSVIPSGHLLASSAFLDYTAELHVKVDRLRHIVKLFAANQRGMQARLQTLWSPLEDESPVVRAVNVKVKIK
jgi:hypothetical protein